MMRYNPFSPKKFRKYHDNDDTQRTSMSAVWTPRCSMDLKPNVSGKGSLTVNYQRSLAAASKRASGRRHVLTTNPSKKKFIHPMTIICGTIMTICVLIPAIIPSIAAGSERGFGGTGFSPCFGGPSFRYVPSANAFDRFCEMVW